MAGIIKRKASRNPNGFTVQFIRKKGVFSGLKANARPCLLTVTLICSWVFPLLTRSGTGVSQRNSGAGTLPEGERCPPVYVTP